MFVDSPGHILANEIQERNLRSQNMSVSCVARSRRMAPFWRGRCGRRQNDQTVVCFVARDFFRFGVFAAACGCLVPEWVLTACPSSLSHLGASSEAPSRLSTNTYVQEKPKYFETLRKQAERKERKVWECVCEAQGLCEVCASFLILTR